MLESFLHFIQFEKRYSKHTFMAYRKDLEQFQEYLSDTFGLEDHLRVEHRHIRSWVVSLVNQKLDACTINRKMAALKSFYKFLLKGNYIRKNPTDKLQSLKTGKKLPQFVRESEMDSLWVLLDGLPQEFEAQRDALVMELLYGTGMRLAELIELKEQDINLTNDTLKVLGKGNKERLIPIGTELRNRINSYLLLKKQQFEGNDQTFLIVNNSNDKAYPMLIYRIVKRVLNQITTIDKRSPHVLRHTFATHLLNKGAELNAVKDLLGHSSLSATQVYTHNSLDKIKEVFNQAHPKA